MAAGGDTYVLNSGRRSGGEWMGGGWACVGVVCVRWKGGAGRAVVWRGWADGWVRFIDYPAVFLERRKGRGLRPGAHAPRI